LESEHDTETLSGEIDLTLFASSFSYLSNDAYLFNLAISSSLTRLSSNFSFSFAKILAYLF
jgi:hypothetical protein